MNSLSALSSALNGTFFMNTVFSSENLRLAAIRISGLRGIGFLGLRDWSSPQTMRLLVPPMMGHRYPSYHWPSLGPRTQAASCPDARRAGTFQEKVEQSRN
jgi:hypothetical protein